jgi:DNA-binding MarR family transcriptional regulator
MMKKYGGYRRLARISRNKMIIRRIVELKRTVKVDTQEMRSKTIRSLELLFDLAVAFAKGEFKTQKEEGKRVKVTLKQRQMWARIAAYIAQILNSIASGFDEKQIDVQLDELERLVSEAKAKAKDEETGKRPVGARGS